MKKKVLGLVVAGVLALGMVGCGSLENIKSSGGWFESKGDYVVINYSGGEIFDIWTLEDAYVQDAGESDGYCFTDDNGNFVTLSGDVLVIRCNDSKTFGQYEEYHKINQSQK